MKTFNVYLAGSIGGFTWQEIATWRAAIKRKTYQIEHPQRIHFLDPLRVCKPPADWTVPVSSTYENDPAAASDIILKKDYRDVEVSDALIVKINEQTETFHPQTSIGTIMEIAWAYANRTPVIVLGNHPSYQHAMVKPAIWHWAQDEDDAVNALIDILGI